MRKIKPNAELKCSARSGAVVIIVLIALILVTTMGIGMARMALLQHRQVERHANYSQTRWLVEAGISRAIAQRNITQDYSAERWDISAEELENRHAARVSIKYVTPNELQVVAVYPLGKTYQSKMTRTIRLDRAAQIEENNEKPQ